MDRWRSDRRGRVKCCVDRGGEVVGGEREVVGKRENGK